jgi:hypothetical protein
MTAFSPRYQMPSVVLNQYEKQVVAPPPIIFSRPFFCLLSSASPPSFLRVAILSRKEGRISRKEGRVLRKEGRIFRKEEMTLRKEGQIPRKEGRKEGYHGRKEMVKRL